MFLQLCWRFQYHYKCDKSLKSAYCGLLRFKYQFPPIPKADWCLGLMIKSIIIRSGRYRLKLKKKKKIQVLFTVAFFSTMFFREESLLKMFINVFFNTSLKKTLINIFNKLLGSIIRTFGTWFQGA